MDLQIRNFGAIENADVKFDGLTVIAGENDTGKSTVGKLVFAVIKAVDLYKKELFTDKEKKINKQVEDLYILARRLSDTHEPAMKEFEVNGFLDELRPFINSNLYASEKSKIDYDKLKPIFTRKINAANEIRSKVLPRVDYIDSVDMLTYIHNIKDETKREINKSNVLQQVLKKVLTIEFRSDFTPQNTDKETFFSIKEGDNGLVEVFGKNNIINRATPHDVTLPFEEVTFIESPIVMQFFKLIGAKDNEKTWFIPSYIKDLALKIVKANYIISSEIQSEEILNLSNKITEIIGGKWSFDGDEEDFIFSVNGENTPQKYPSNNTASGIKSFGIIQLLLLAEILNNRSLLIIDEPETHLHPKWQVEYAKVICLLVKHEIPVLLTSHSPYLIQALRRYSEEFGIERFTNYYLAERNDNGLVDIEHVNHDLNRVFLKLSQPLHDLVWK